jgi:RNA recognition motif-containing protein
MSMKLYVGNLPYSVTEEDLRKLFADYGEIEEAVIIIDKFSQRSKGFGFVTLTDSAMAAKAIEELNGKEFDGRAIVVNEARPREERPAGGRSFGGGNRGGYGNRNDN